MKYINISIKTIFSRPMLPVFCCSVLSNLFATAVKNSNFIFIQPFITIVLSIISLVFYLLLINGIFECCKYNEVDIDVPIFTSLGSRLLKYIILYISSFSFLFMVLVACIIMGMPSIFLFVPLDGIAFLQTGILATMLKIVGLCNLVLINIILLAFLVSLVCLFVSFLTTFNYNISFGNSFKSAISFAVSNLKNILFITFAYYAFAVLCNYGIPILNNYLTSMPLTDIYSSFGVLYIFCIAISTIVSSIFFGSITSLFFSNAKKINP